MNLYKTLDLSFFDEWSFLPEDPVLKEKVQETVVKDGKINNRWVKCCPIPESNIWFETAWVDYRNGKSCR